MNPMQAQNGIPNDDILSKSFILSQLKDVDRELARMGAKIIRVNKMNGDFYPCAEVVIDFDCEALREYIAQHQQPAAQDDEKAAVSVGGAKFAFDENKRAKGGE